MTLREILNSLNIHLEGYDTLQDLKVANADNFCLFKLLEYFRSEKLKEDLTICSSAMDEAAPLGKNLSLYFTNEYKDGNIAITMKVCDSIADSKH